jgi:hypothetical protein
MYPAHIEIKQLIDKNEALKRENIRLRQELRKAVNQCLKSKIMVLEETTAYSFQFE